MTTAGWVKLNSTASDVAFWGNYGGSGAKEYSIGFNTGASFVLRYSGDGTTENNLNTTSFSVSTGTWYFLLAEYDGTGDVLEITVNNSSSFNTSFSGFATTSSAFNVGRESSPGRYFNGLVDSLSVWNRILTTEEKAALYNGGSGLDYDNF